MKNETHKLSPSQKFPLRTKEIFVQGGWSLHLLGQKLLWLAYVLVDVLNVENHIAALSHPQQTKPLVQ